MPPGFLLLQNEVSQISLCADNIGTAAGIVCLVYLGFAIFCLLISS